MRVRSTKLMVFLGLLNLAVLVASILMVGKLMRELSRETSIAAAPASAPTSLKLPVPVPQ